MLRALGEEYGVSLHGRVIPNGTMHAANVLTPEWDEKEPVILAAGRVWDEAKNIEAISRVAGDLPWPVYVAGDQKAPEGSTRALPGLRMLGRLPAAEITSWQRRAAIYVSPARYEPFGLAILEAAGAGCALVLGDIPSLRENWEGAAVFVDPDDAAALREAVVGLIEDERERRRRGLMAWQRAARFSIERAADEYVGVYEDVTA
jgi:glycosyltransferase involved in cell wall biosynthesis